MKNSAIPVVDELKSTTWQEELGQAVSSVHELYEILGLDCAKIHTPKSFGLKVPRAFVRKMKQGDLNDPLLLQVLPDTQETIAMAGYSNDPLLEHEHNPIKGLLHKYKSRVLITTTGACAVHCRYCFRQHFDYQANMPTAAQMGEIGSYIAACDDIDEVIFSGGDPLSLSHRRLALWFEMINALPNIKTIRIHTRLPVVLPSRVDDALLTLLKNSPKNIVMVLHINHANEIDTVLQDKCQALKQAGITLLNQTVLLKSVNDDVDTLCKLSHALFGVGVLPYYLHVLDKVQGAAHFDVPIAQAVEIYWQMLERLSGYLVPKLVQELPNKPYKTPVNLYRE
ncbi:EF-P beta-lysylation protein EpmB [Moraxella haemolytica]|uniref:EF-P beta-lysylation protein EpmB n=1 Tax=Moraxella haemolytica TaxID=2904119 RepID=UPI0025434F70|nr:EF-P beta-lysylation protein EpmB [Moraxella sp. ZY171148]WII95650.1 EF-P beta-lysylation protein EpmB [Moraxella sp. ZY171148]